MVRLKNKGIFIFAILCILLMIIIYVVPGVGNLMKVSYVAEYGELSIYDDTTGYMVRNESVYEATANGKLNRLSKDGELIRKGTAAVEVSDGKEPEESDEFTKVKDKLKGKMISVADYKVTEGGLVSYYVDGMESKLTLKYAKSADEKFFSSLDKIEAIKLPESTAHKGYPLFKIVDGTKWYIVAFVRNGSAKKYEKGATIDVMFNPEKDRDIAQKDSDLIQMKVVEVSKSGGKTKLLLESNRYFDGIGSMRSVPVRLTTFNARGLILEKSSITKLDGKTGVYVKDKKGKQKFVPVNVIGEDGDKVVVSDSYYTDKNQNKVRTLDPFSDVIKRP